MQKFLGLMSSPLSIGMILILVALVFSLGRRRWPGSVVLALALCWLWLWSLPSFSHWLRAGLESRYVPLAVDQYPDQGADVIVIAGGAFGPTDQPYPDLNAAADRYWHAARLHRAGKASWILVSGGRHPDSERATEAELGRRFLVDLGIPSERIVLEDQALTTRDNAVYTARVLEQRQLSRVLLVTSALHMRRAQAAFAAAGIQAAPAATDFETRHGNASGQRWRRWLPSAQALADSSRAWHEYVGYLYYRWRGWA